MKFDEKARGILAILLATVTILSAALLPACSSGIVDPIGDVSDIDDWTPSLTDEEAEALFGHTETQALQHIDGDYLYYIGRLREGSDSRTVYRYNLRTGETQLACQDTTCPHTEGSSCPFERVSTSTTVLCAVNGGVVYVTWGPNQLQWYHPDTREHKVFDVEEPLLCHKAGDSVYYDKVTILDAPEHLGDARREMWRLDIASGKSTLVGTGRETDQYLRPYLLDGQETILLYSLVGPDEKVEQDGFWIYRVNGENEDRIPLYEDKLSCYGINPYGKYFFYNEYDIHWYETHDTEPPRVLHLVDSTTGENRILDEDSADDAFIVMTGRCVMALKDDPTGEHAQILRCYDYLTGEQKDYPLEGEKWRGPLMYYRGRIYMESPYQTDGSDEVTARATIVAWDIFSGRQQVLGKREIAVETSETSDLPSEEARSFRSLTDEEAEARFGHTEKHATTNIDGQYLYYAGAGEVRRKGETDYDQTMYRYDCLTGEIEHACQDPDCEHQNVCRDPNCDHAGESDCPFAYMTESTDIFATDGRITYFTVGYKQLEEYTPETGEHKLLSSDAERSTQFFMAGNAVYFINSFYNDDTDGWRQELWRIDPESEEAERVVVYDERGGIQPYLLNGEETVVIYTSIGPDGNPAQDGYYWIYRMEDASTGERTLLYEKAIPDPSLSVSGEYICFSEDISWWYSYDESMSSPKNLHLVNATTGEDRIVDEDSYGADRVILTDRVVMTLKSDPEGKYAYILQCYDYHTGETTEYPLLGEAWSSHNVMYYGGQLYFTAPRQYEKSGREKKAADLVVWDIVSGHQRVITADEIVEKH